MLLPRRGQYVGHGNAGDPVCLPFTITSLATPQKYPLGWGATIVMDSDPRGPLGGEKWDREGGHLWRCLGENACVVHFLKYPNFNPCFNRHPPREAREVGWSGPQTFLTNHAA